MLCCVQSNQTGPSRCSAFNDSPFADQINCSVLQPGGPKQACSALNPAQQRNDCSAFRDQGPTANCSVLTSGQQFRKFCSVGRPGPKTCSTYGDFAQCSAGLGASRLRHSADLLHRGELASRSDALGPYVYNYSGGP